MRRNHWGGVVYVGFIQGDAGAAVVASRVQGGDAVAAAVRRTFKVVGRRGCASRGQGDDACVADLVEAVCT